MVARTIESLDFNGNKKSEKYYFNLTRLELAEMNFEFDGGFEGYLERLRENPDIRSTLKVVKDLVLKAYGVKTEDGGFAKSQSYTEKFAATDAYSELILGFLNNGEQGGLEFAEFLERVVNVEPGSIDIKAIENEVQAPVKEIDAKVVPMPEQ